MFNNKNQKATGMTPEIMYEQNKNDRQKVYRKATGYQGMLDEAHQQAEKLGIDITESTEDNEVDAFRHIYASAVWTYEYGRNTGKLGKMAVENVVNSHENDRAKSEHEQKANVMDYHNNEIGFKIGQELLKYKFEKGEDFKQIIMDKVNQAIKNGEAITNLEDNRIENGWNKKYNPNVSKPSDKSVMNRIVDFVKSKLPKATDDQVQNMLIDSKHGAYKVAGEIGIPFDDLRKIKDESLAYAKQFADKRKLTDIEDPEEQKLVLREYRNLKGEITANDFARLHAGSDVQVSSYTRSDGTQVQSHTRSRPG